VYLVVKIKAPFKPLPVDSAPPAGKAEFVPKPGS
jgi:hypothetical protein